MPPAPRFAAPTPSRSAAPHVRRFRIALYRFRHLLAAFALLAALWWAVSSFAPAPDSRAVVVAASEIRAGEHISETNIELREIPEAGIPPDAAVDLEDVLGDPAIIGIQPGTVLTTAMVASPNLGHTLHSGEVVVPVTFADRGSLSVARPGQIVWLYANTDEEVARVGSEARVLAILSAPEAGLLDSGGEDLTDGLVAVQASEARVLLDALSRGPLRAVLPAT